MPLVCYVSEQNLNVPLDSDRLLRLLGVSVKLSGFYYAVYMLEQVQQKPDHVLLITKRLYKQTAQHFETTSGCVERNLRTLVRACWRQPDHTLLDQIAGRPLRKPPTNMQFLDMLSAYLRKLNLVWGRRGLPCSPPHSYNLSSPRKILDTIEISSVFRMR